MCVGEVQGTVNFTDVIKQKHLRYEVLKPLAGKRSPSVLLKQCSRKWLIAVARVAIRIWFIACSKLEKCGKFLLNDSHVGNG